MTQAAGALELSGTAATLVLLVPLIVLFAVIWRTVRQHQRSTPRQAPRCPERGGHSDVSVRRCRSTNVSPQRSRIGDDFVLSELYLLKARDASSAGQLGLATELLRKSVGSACNDRGMSRSTPTASGSRGDRAGSRGSHDGVRALAVGAQALP